MTIEFPVLIRQVAQDYGPEVADNFKQQIETVKPATYADLLDLLDQVLLGGRKPIEIHHGAASTMVSSVSFTTPAK